MPSETSNDWPSPQFHNPCAVRAFSPEAARISPITEFDGRGADGIAGLGVRPPRGR